MKFAFDLDNTINAAPVAMATICNSLMATGHEVHIVTARFDYHHNITVAELKEYNLHYTSLSFSEDKEQVCKSLGIDMALDDNIHYYYPSFQRFTIGFANLKEPPTESMKLKSQLAHDEYRFNDANIDGYYSAEYSAGYDDGFKRGANTMYDQMISDAGE